MNMDGLPLQQFERVHPRGPIYPSDPYGPVRANANSHLLAFWSRYMQRSWGNSCREDARIVLT